jgi:hypothetical protein
MDEWGDEKNARAEGIARSSGVAELADGGTWTPLIKRGLGLSDLGRKLARRSIGEVAALLGKNIAHEFRWFLESLKTMTSQADVRIVLVYYNPLSARAVEVCGLFKRKQVLWLPFDPTRKVQRECFVYFTW